MDSLPAIKFGNRGQLECDFPVLGRMILFCRLSTHATLAYRCSNRSLCGNRSLWLIGVVIGSWPCLHQWFTSIIGRSHLHNTHPYTWCSRCITMPLHHHALLNKPQPFSPLFFPTTCDTEAEGGIKGISVPYTNKSLACPTPISHLIGLSVCLH